MRWTEMTSPDMEKIGNECVLVWPLASCEQHGNHLPVFTDTRIATEIGERLETAAPERVVLLPTLWLGASHHHRLFPGTLSVTETMFGNMIQSVLECLLESPVCAPGRAKRIFLLNGHGGNIYPGQAAMSEFAWKYRHRPDVIVAFGSYWVTADEAMASVKMETDALTHACEYETSLMLAIDGKLVHMDRAKAEDVRWENTRFTPDASRGSKVGVAAPFHARSANGALGNPEFATEEKGKKLLDAVTADLGKFMDEFVGWPDLDDAGLKKRNREFGFRKK